MTTFRSDFDVALVDFMGGDLAVCQAARVSTQGADSFDSDENDGLINFLMKNRHGSPFEHSVFKWMISAPIFVWREFMRHRIASYNEESGRYKQLAPVFYIPPAHRPLLQIGKAGAYSFIPGGERHQEIVRDGLQYIADEAYEAYLYMLSCDIAREVARMCLPLNIYSTAFVTMNARGLMNFLSLRTKHEDAAYPSFPQWEINQIADAMEVDFRAKMPRVAEAFHRHGRVQP